MHTPLEVLSLYPPHEATLASWLAARVAVAADRPCLEFGERVLTYAEIESASRRAAALYAGLGVRAGDRVGVMAHNHPSTVLTLLALARLGAVLVPVNP
ncbi:MAG TPA: AMP-binding protein, partial [Rubrivivax sp.]|nr:AMP-binding protein [Rubrivivax sp.]